MNTSELKILEERLTSLEIKISFIEDYMNQIQHITVSQDEIIEKLQNQNRLLSRRLNELYEIYEEIPNRKPPHY